MNWQSLQVEHVYSGRNVRHWRVSRGAAGERVTVRESALYSRVYACLACRSIECDHVIAVRDFDGATEKGAASRETEASA